MVNFPEEDHGSEEDGNASSEEGNGADEEGNGSAGVDGNDSGIEGNGAACEEAEGGSLEGSVGSDQGGRATSSTDSCACAARTNVKRIATTSADVLPAIRRAISAAVGAAAWAERGAKR